MATYGQTVRRGLPRRPGGDPWPPSAALPAESALVPAASVVPVGDRVLRRGLPRTPGGDPWPPAASAPVHPSPVHAEVPESRAQVTDEPAARIAITGAGTGAVAGFQDNAPVGDRALRRGLPRTPGGEPWPAAGLAPSRESASVETKALSPETETLSAGSAGGVATDVSVPLPFTRTVFPGRAAVVFEQERRSGALHHDTGAGARSAGSPGWSGPGSWSSAVVGCCSRPGWRCWRCGSCSASPRSRSS